MFFDFIAVTLSKGIFNAHLKDNSLNVSSRSSDDSLQPRPESGGSLLDLWIDGAKASVDAKASSRRQPNFFPFYTRLLQ